MRRVLVTRPEPGATATAARLRLAGFDPVILPLTKIVALDPGPIEDGSWRAVAITSANAVRHAPQTLAASLGRLPVFAVGDATAAVARSAGFFEVRSGSGDAMALAALLLRTLSKSAAVLYLCGHVRRPEFERMLGEAGITVRAVETYDTVATEIEDAAWGGPAIDAVTVHSAEAARALARHTERTAVAERMVRARLVAISARAAEPVATIFANRVRVAREPTDAAMVEALIGAD